MPGIALPYSANDPQPFHAFAQDFPFFTSFGFGYVAHNFQRYLAEGVPIMPVDDQGRGNAYPLMQRVLDNPFLLLFLGVAIPAVFYIIWGIIEITQIPIAD